MSLTLFALAAMAQDPDPRLWLEAVDSDEALDWVRARNAETTEAWGSDELRELEKTLLEIYDSDDKIPYVSKRGDRYFNFWTDAEHQRGLWRTTTLDSYRTESPEWDVLLDVDALNEEEGENWVYKGSTCLPPAYERCLLRLSRGGADAVVVREFDIPSKSFVEGGFVLPEAKQSVSWIDRDTLFVASDFGEGTLTESGYPRQVKLWRRGTPLQSAELVYEGEASDISVGAYADHTPGFERQFVYRSPTFFTNQVWERRKGKLLPIAKPDDVNVEVHRDIVVFELRKDWEHDGVTYEAGSLLASSYKKWMKGKGELTVIFEPTESRSLSSFGFTDQHLYLNLLDDVKSVVEIYTPGKDGFTMRPLEGVPAFGKVSVSAVDADESDLVWMTVTDYLTPTSLLMGEITGSEHEQLKTSPSWFDAEGLTVSQHFATSDDGTRIPYFQVGPAELPEGGAPTLLYGYGGFEVSLLPGYSGTIGKAWLEKGGVYVVANIRGGGEYGPRWHQAALKENRHKAYEDFAAVARDLVERGVTTHDLLGTRGGSNGGLLMGNMYTQYPELFGAVVCAVPLLDMKRYTKLLAGASWAGEYGDPDDPEQWSFIQTFSPYHNIRPDADYPPILFTTSTRDDRVHPGHARKMAHALLEAGKQVDYYENIEGGHGGAADNKQAAFMSALAYSWLWDQLTAPDQDEVAQGDEGEPEGDEG
jgi:prolyl oligopeptidase